MTDIILKTKAPALRPYQEMAVDNITESWDNGFLRVLLQLPTGGGKTVIFAEIVRKLVYNCYRVLILAHREELIDQAVSKLENVGVEAGVIKAGREEHPERMVQVASVQTLYRRKDKPDADYLIIDEAHHVSEKGKTYKAIIDHYPDIYTLGVTATPAKTNGHGFGTLFDELIVGASVAGLIKQGYLCDFRLLGSKAPISTSGVRKVAGEFNQTELADLIVGNKSLTDSVISEWLQEANGKQTVVFAVNIAHCHELLQAFTGAGVAAEFLEGKSPTEERKAILERFRTGDTVVLVNCGIVSEGFDMPAIEVIQCVRPTASLVLWLQMIGRALRPAPWLNKTEALILDHTANWQMHGLPDEDRKWSLKPVSMIPAIGTIKCCRCDHVFRAYPQELDAGRCNCPACDFEMIVFKPEPGSKEPTQVVQVTGDSVAKLQSIQKTAEAVGQPLIESAKYWQRGFDLDMTAFKAGERTKEPSKGRFWYKFKELFERRLRRQPNVAEWKFLEDMCGYKHGWYKYRIDEINL